MPFRFANVSGRSALVDSDDQWYDLARLSRGEVSSDPMAALQQTARLHELADTLAAAAPDGHLSDAEVSAPVPAPRNVFAIGLNYRLHAAESGMDLPAVPLVFTKFPSCISPPNADIVLNSVTGDYEVELVVVIGGETRNVAIDQAWQHVLGVTVGQDVSDRALQFAAKPPHFDLGKSRDTYGPLGPVLVSTDSFADPTDLEISCWVNGEQRQHDRTSNLIFSVAELISYLSGILTLQMGDIIFTGTPAGVGSATRNYLKPGDVVVSAIEGIGTITNHCI